MLKIEKLIVGIVLFLIVATVGLLLLSRYRNKQAFPPDSFQAGSGEDFETEGVVKEINGSLFSMTLAGGEDKGYLLMNQVVYLCLPEDDGYYSYLKNVDRYNLNTDYLITREDVPSKVKVGEKVEVFLYEYSPDKIFIKAIIDIDC